MNSLPEYSLAVNNLRMHKCTSADVALFNSRAIKTMSNPDGIDMSHSENIEATAIVSTNSLRTTINFHKSYGVCNVKNGPDLVICAALDSVNNEVVPTPNRSKLLQMDVSCHIKDGALPSFIPLYIGMPIILRCCNISTDLKITNGSKGIVRQINISHCPSNFTYATAVIVEFQESPVVCSNLSPSYFPIEPITVAQKTISMFPDLNIIAL